MRVALLSVVELAKDAEGASVPRGLLPFGRGNIALRQLELALCLGCERIVCLGQSLSPAIIELQRVCELAKAQFHFVRSAHNVAALVKSGDELLVLTDGLLADPREAKALLSGGSAVVVLPVETGVAQGFERIDLNRAWGGAMIVPGALAERLFDLPEDADPTASLLRIALQARVPERELPSQLVGDAWALIRTAEEASVRENAWIRRTALRSDAFSPARWLGEQAIAWRGTAIIQQGLQSGTLLVFSLCLVAAALLAANFWLASAGLLLFAVAIVVLEAGLTLRLVEGRDTGGAMARLDWLRWLYELPLTLLLAFGIGTGQNWQTSLFVPLVTLGLTRLAASISGNRWARVIEDRAFLAIIAALFAFLGQLLPALQACSIILIAVALFATTGEKR